MNNNFVTIGIAVILLALGYFIGVSQSQRYTLANGYMLDTKTGQTWMLQSYTALSPVPAISYQWKELPKR